MTNGRTTHFVVGTKDAAWLKFAALLVGLLSLLGPTGLACYEHVQHERTELALAKLRAGQAATQQTAAKAADSAQDAAVSADAAAKRAARTEKAVSEATQ